MLTFERANELFKYEPETGMLIRKVTTGNNRFHAGAAAGCPSPDGYLRVRIDKVLHQVHRVCYLLAYRVDKHRVKKYCAEIKVK